MQPVKPRKSKMLVPPLFSTMCEDSSGDLVFCLEVGFDDGTR